MASNKQANVAAASNNMVVRMQQRIAAVQAKRAAKHATRIAARNAAAEAAAKLAAYQQKLAELQAEFGMPAVAPKTVSVPRGTGVCGQVHAIAAKCNYDRKATLAACKEAGINPATAQTQYALAKKAASAAVAA